MQINGEEFNVTPEAWDSFEGFWGDKAYREAGWIESFEALIRKLVAEGR